MSYSLYVYVAESEFPMAAWEALLGEFDFVRQGDEWRWRYAEAGGEGVRVQVARVTAESRLAPPGARWCADVRTTRGRGPGEAWRQLALPYRALRSLPRVEVCDPELSSAPRPLRFASAEVFSAHAAQLAPHLTAAGALVERGWMSAAGFLIL